MKRATLALVAQLALAALVAGCPAPPVIPQTFNFDRPADVELLCLRVPVLPTGLLTTAVNTIVPRPMADCVVDPFTNITPRDQVPAADDPAAPPDPMSPNTYGFRLFAVVTQSNRGEVAVVALHPQFNTGIQDNDHRVPGYTFIPVGRFPGAIAVDPRGVDSLAAFRDPSLPRGGVTYIANTGESTISVLDNNRLLSPGPNRLATDGHEPTNTGATPLNITSFVELHTTGAPRDLAIVPRGPDCATNGPMCRYVLYATVPEAGVIQSWDVTNPRRPMQAPDVHVMAVAAMRGDAGMDGGMDATAGGGGSEAGADGGDSAPFPTQIALDETGRMYVADEHQAIIHTFDAMPDGTLVESPAPIVTGVPTRYVAVSPVLPQNEQLQDDALTGKRFVYAIANTDGAVMVLDPSTPAAGPLRVNLIADRPECGAGGNPFDPQRCARLDPLQLRFDRLPLIGPARAITFVNRDVPTTDPACVGARPNAEDMPNGSGRGSPLAPRCNPDATGDPGAGPRNLRGVQAVIALQSGPLQIVDLRDPDRACLTAVRTVSVTINGTATNRQFLPHMARAAQLFTPGPMITSGPTLLINNSSSSASDQLPRIVPLDNSDMPCSAGSNPPFCVLLPQVPQPVDLPATASFVSAIDPLATRDDTWNITYQGVLPFLTLNAAQFREGSAPDQLTMDAPGAEFCTRGALRNDIVVIASPSPLVIEPTVDAGMLPPGLDAEVEDAATEDRFCRDIFGTSASPCNRDLNVETATNGQLVLRLPHAMDTMGNIIYGDTSGCSAVQFTNAMGANGPADLRAAIHRCFPQAARVEVRAGNQWVVAGVRAGYQHNVVVDAMTGECTQDPTRFPTGRLVPDTTYVSPAFTIRIASGTQDVGGRRVPVPPPRGTAFQFAVTGGNFPLAVDGGWLPGALRYSCTNQRLYIVDQARASLYEFNTASLVSPRTFN